MENGVKILSKEQIADLNKKGHNLDASGDTLYVMGFILDDSENSAVDPAPFKVSKDAVEKIVRKGLTRPWLPGKKGDKLHFRPKPDATDAEILELQKNHAGGELVDYVMNEEGNRAWGIFKIWPEWRDMFENKELSEELPPFLSPMIGNWKEDETTGEIIDGELLHVHSVDHPGYDRAYARFIGKCNGPIDQCMRELRPLAAAGLVKEWRDNSCPCPKNFLNTKLALASAGMQPTDTQPPKNDGSSTPSLETVSKDVESLKSTYSALSQEVSSIKTMTEAISAKLGITAGETPEGGAPPAVAAAGKDEDAKKGKSAEIDAVKAELAELKKEAKAAKEAEEKRVKTAAEKERRRLARIIAAHELLVKKSITEDKRKEREDHYFNLKEEGTENLQDLRLLAATYEEELRKIVPDTEEEAIAIAAAGDEYGIHGDTEPDYDSIEASVTEEL